MYQPPSLPWGKGVSPKMRAKHLISVCSYPILGAAPLPLVRSSLLPFGRNESLTRRSKEYSADRGHSQSGTQDIG